MRRHHVRDYARRVLADGIGRRAQRAPIGSARAQAITVAGRSVTFEWVPNNDDHRRGGWVYGVPGTAPFEANSLADAEEIVRSLFTDWTLER